MLDRSGQLGHVTTGTLLRGWRQQRNLSQMALALMANSSAKHVSFVENDRARPSRKLILRLADVLEVPTQERDSMLLASGYAPLAERPPVVESRTYTAKEAAYRLLKGHEPYPALAYDTALNIVQTNQALMNLLTEAVAPELLEPPVSALRLSLHPDGLAGHVINFTEWRDEELSRLRSLARSSGNEQLRSLYGEVSAYAYPGRGRLSSYQERDRPEIFVGSLHLRALDTELRFFSSTTEFASADGDINALSIATFHPGDAHTASALHHHLSRPRSISGH
ncbi:helix-turn-helix domain-containing protein [Streptomyces sp. NPDC088116]|uniref:helix-turn-helix domain-containing protein n=1 Tax=Streptomyces sp. NPDC088116 TaxID=3365825 RepID=UPI0038253A5F